MEKIRILHIIHGLNIGGAENFIFNVLSILDANKYIFDFAIQNHRIGHTKFKDLIETRGGTIYFVTDFRKNILKHKNDLECVLDKGYDYVHIHMNAFVNPFPALVAAKYNNKVIIHSHNTNSDGGFLGRCIHLFNRKLFLKDSFIRIACGNDAGKWMFEKKTYRVINNAVNLYSYAYNEKSRYEIREKYNLKDEFIVGQIGRLCSVKNQQYSINLLKKIIDNYPNLEIRLMIVGEGDDKQSLIALAKDSNLSDKVIFTGPVNNPNQYYSAFDCLLLPSLFEGFAFVAVEAQAAGLKVIASNNNTSEINITGSVRFLSLKKNEEWIDNIIGCLTPYDRESISNKMIGTVFDNNRLKTAMVNLYV